MSDHGQNGVNGLFVQRRAGQEHKQRSGLVLEALPVQEAISKTDLVHWNHFVIYVSKSWFALHTTVIVYTRAVKLAVKGQPADLG